MRRSGRGGRGGAAAQTYARGFRSAVVVAVWGRQRQQDGAHLVLDIVLEDEILFQKNQEHFLTRLSNLEEEKGKR